MFIKRTEKNSLPNLVGAPLKSSGFSVVTNLYILGAVVVIAPTDLVNP